MKNKLYKGFTLKDFTLMGHYGHTMLLEQEYDVGTDLSFIRMNDEECMCEVTFAYDGSREYTILSYLYAKQLKGCSISFERYGGRYGRLGYTDSNGVWNEVVQSIDFY